jgi:stearoyl-CoA desaturase (delta-9 desaturase)
MGWFVFGGGLSDGLAYLIYGVFVKTFLVTYLSNAVDLLNHSHGYRNYETSDLSSNSPIMAVLHGGGAITWHNNHHAHPGYFYVRKKWWEFDLHYQLLRFLSMAKLVTNIKVLDETKDSLGVGR